MQFYNKNGTLTDYALSCGYIEVFSIASTKVTLWKEYGAYHVRKHDHGTGERVSWEVFDRLSEARRFFKRSKLN